MCRHGTLALMLSELEMIAALRAVAVGIGDDAAVLPGGLVLASDMLVEGVHFDRSRSDVFSIGRRAAGANLSDMAAMGAVPVCMVAAFGVPPGFDDVAGIAAGIADYGVELVGGDLSRADQLVISIAALGRADRPALRSGGNPGDLLVVTGVLGTQAASGYTAPVTPRIAEGRSLAKVASAMIDLSDGIASDAARLAEASDCAAVVELELLPRADAVSVELAAVGGEDFELLAAIPPSAAAPVPVTVVGRLEAGRGVRLIDADGTPVDLRGWDHFA
jgi:thiamine-monophosphate kinase